MFTRRTYGFAALLLLAPSLFAVTAAMATEGGADSATPAATHCEADKVREEYDEQRAALRGTMTIKLDAAQEVGPNTYARTLRSWDAASDSLGVWLEEALDRAARTDKLTACVSG